REAAAGLGRALVVGDDGCHKRRGSLGAGPRVAGTAMVRDRDRRRGGAAVRASAAATLTRYLRQRPPWAARVFRGLPASRSPDVAGDVRQRRNYGPPALPPPSPL